MKDLYKISVEGFYNKISIGMNFAYFGDHLHVLYKVMIQVKNYFKYITKWYKYKIIQYTEGYNRQRS